MSITHFVPTIWSETLYQELQKNFVAVNHCNRDFEGEIKKKGSVVNICGLSDIVLKTYTKNSDITSPETLSDSATQLVIDQAKFFNFQIDDINRAQCSPKLMEAAMQRAAEVIANDADRHIFSLYKSAGKTITNTKDGEETLFDTILAAREYLYENNVGDGTELFLEVSPKVAARILKEQIAIPSTRLQDLRLQQRIRKHEQRHPRSQLLPQNQARHHLCGSDLRGRGLPSREALCRCGKGTPPLRC